MKKIYIYLILFIAVFSLSSCKNKYEISESADLLEYGKRGEYGFSYVNEDGDKEYYYKVPLNIVVGAVDNTKKSKYTICYVYYNRVNAKKEPRKRFLFFFF